MRRSLGISVIGLSLVVIGWNTLIAQEAALTAPPGIRIAAVGGTELRSWDRYLEDQQRAGALRIRTTRQDPDVPSRTFERLDQFHNGVVVWGSNVVRNTELGVSSSIFGSLSPDIDVSTRPALTAADATRAIVDRGGAPLITAPQLIVLPLVNGGYALAYTAAVASPNIARIFVDANTGEELWRYSELMRQSAVGTGVGVLGDTKKLSVLQRGGAFVATDTHRPPVIETYDMRGSLPHAFAVLTGGPLIPADLATDSDNTWTDPAVIDAHAHIAWTYDYFFKRFGRHGLDDRDRPITALVNPVTQQGALTLTGGDINFAVNAFWCSLCGPDARGVMLFGNGIPSNFTFGGQSYTYLAGALDIVAHELTHAVTTSTSNLMPSNESGALNEAFSDMMGTSAEFFYRDLNVSRGQADYLIGEDAIRGVRAGTLDGIRSLSNPRQYGDPDHYRNKYTGPDDDGGLHTNATIPGHAFYLAIEGGTNRTSGQTVSGVGAANREQIEKAFYRAFTLMLPANATFVTTRTATTQAARDLYGANSRAEQAIDQAWSAVGVPDARTISTYTGTVAAGRAVSSVFTMSGAGTYHVNLRGNDAGVDLDMYLTPNTAACSTAPAVSCRLAVSITPAAVESVKWPVRAGESYRIWVDNLSGRASTFTVEHFITP